MVKGHLPHKMMMITWEVEKKKEEEEEDESKD